MPTRSVSKNIRVQGTNIEGDFVITTKGTMLSRQKEPKPHRYATSLNSTWEQIPAGTILLMVRAINAHTVEVLHNEALWQASTNTLFYINPQKDLNEMAFCITGKLEYPRDYYATLIKYCGGKFKKAVSRNVDYLVTGKNVGATKLDKAKRYDTTVINEDEFHKMMGLSRI